MMIIARIFILIMSLLSSALLYSDDMSITTDSRIKTYIYNPNEIFLLITHYGFQSQIEFAKGEEIQTISLGDSYSWKITPLQNRIFIKPMERNIRTNMTVLTNKRSYQFDIVARDVEYDENPEDMVYLVKFYYPKKVR